MRKRLIVGNWKMNMLRNEALEVTQNLSELLRDLNEVDIVIAPPYTSLDIVYKVICKTKIQLAAQNVFWEQSGAFTGEISPYMLIDAGCKWVIIGHSERRVILGESDNMVQRKIKASINAGLIPILCVGETLDERKKGYTMKVIKNQLEEGLKSINIESPNGITIAYEPVWAIGTGNNATPEDAQEVHGFIRETLNEIFIGIADKIRILYGGSVTPENIKDIILPLDIDGALIGGASLRSDSFAKIAKLIGGMAHWT
ncbi:MAG TPA: triose-phosphate isomerase [Thermodesulfobacteriota bacterium]